MFPIRDRQPRRRFPIVTIALVLVNVLAFAYQMMVLGSGGQSALNQMIYDFGVVPARVDIDPLPLTALTFVTSMFLHGSLIHIGSNMLYLWIFGDNVEDAMGHGWFLIFYLITGFAASFAQLMMSQGSNVPAIGASGAIAGVLAAYLIYYPSARVDTLVVLGYFVRIRRIRAVFVLGLWFVLQLFNGFASFGMDQAEGGVAWFAHIGGFVAGLVLALPWLRQARSQGIRSSRSSWF